jgi:hypothetical protein
MDHHGGGHAGEEGDEEAGSEEGVDAGAAELEGKAAGPPAAFERGLRAKVDVRQRLVGGKEDFVAEAPERVNEFEDVTADSSGWIDERSGVDGEAHVA